MAIKTPKSFIGKKDIFPTGKGWVKVSGPKKKQELLKSANFSAAEIAEWFAQQSSADVPVVQTPEPVVVDPVPQVEPEIQPFSTAQAESLGAPEPKREETQMAPPRGINPNFVKNPVTGKWEKKNEEVVKNDVQTLTEAPSIEKKLTESEIKHHYGSNNTVH